VKCNLAGTLSITKTKLLWQKISIWSGFKVSSLDLRSNTSQSIDKGSSESEFPSDDINSTLIVFSFFFVNDNYKEAREVIQIWTCFLNFRKFQIEDTLRKPSDLSIKLMIRKGAFWRKNNSPEFSVYWIFCLAKQTKYLKLLAATDCSLLLIN